MHAYIHEYIHTYIYTYIHVYIHYKQYINRQCNILIMLYIYNIYIYIYSNVEEKDKWIEDLEQAIRLSNDSDLQGNMYSTIKASSINGIYKIHSDDPIILYVF